MRLDPRSTGTTLVAMSPAANQTAHAAAHMNGYLIVGDYLVRREVSVGSVSWRAWDARYTNSLGDPQDFCGALFSTEAEAVEFAKRKTLQATATSTSEGAKAAGDL